MPIMTLPVRMIVPFPRHGGSDIVSRMVAQALSEQLGRAVAVDNLGGESGIIGATQAARAKPDGETLYFGGTATLAINALIHIPLPYDPIGDFAPVSMLGTAPSVLLVNPALGIGSVSELIDALRKKPKMRFASAGAFTPTHLCAELFQNMTGTSMVHVAHEGGGPALADALAGRVDIYFSGLATAMPVVKAGRLRALAVTSAERLPSMPDMPTVSESGLPGFEVVNWYAMLLPAGAPPAIISSLNAIVRKAVASSELQAHFAEHGASAAASSPDEAAAFIVKESRKWSDLIRRSGVSLNA